MAYTSKTSVNYRQRSCSYRVFQRFGQAKFADSGSILGSSQFTQLPQLPEKMMLDLKKVKFDSKIIILLC